MQEGFLHSVFIPVVNFSLLSLSTSIILFKLSFAVPLKQAVNNHSQLRTGLHGLHSHFVSS